VIPFIDLKKQYQELAGTIEKAVRGVLSSGTYILGPNVGCLEEEIALYCGTRRAVALASGTDALILALRAVGIGPGDEVITTPYTFFATAEAVSQLGAVPVFVDIKEDTLNLDPELIETKISSRTKAILPVHIFGQPAEMDGINRIARKYGLAVVEDACQAIGGEYQGKRVGSLGNLGCFSFFPTKNLGCYGDGGMVVTDDQDLADQIVLWRSHGSRKKYYHQELGCNSRLDELQAAVLRIKLGFLEEWNRERERLAFLYSSLLQGADCKLQGLEPGSRSVWNLFVLRTGKRQQVASYLEQREVGTGIYYPMPLHLQEVYANLGYREGDLPIAEKACREALALPLYPGLKDEQVEWIAGLVRQVID
jgi:dTDP-4-amino-4,6-dideoxygalactose transaminase